MNATKNYSSNHLPELDAAKGLLIFLILIGHNSFLSEAMPQFYLSLYRFHVTAFLLLPFVFPAKPLCWKQWFDRLVRYGVPGLWFFCTTFVLYTFLVLPEFSWRERGLSFVQGIIIGSAKYSDLATGFKLYWFVPVLISLVTIRAVFSQRSKIGIAILAVVVHLGLGAINRKVAMAIPAGFPIVFYVLPLGFIVEVIRDPIIKASRTVQRHLGTASLAIFLLGTWIANRNGWTIDVGAIRVPHIRTPMQLLTMDIIALSGFGCCLYLGSKLTFSWLVQLGKGSYIVYLTHSLLFQMQLVFLERFRDTLAGSHALAGVCTLFTTLGLCLITIRIIESNPILQKLFFPRNVQEFMLARIVTPNR